MKESGEWATSPDWVLTTTLKKVDSGWSSITIGNNALARFFEVTDTGDDFVLTVNPTFPHCRLIEELYF